MNMIITAESAADPRAGMFAGVLRMWHIFTMRVWCSFARPSPGWDVKP
jgi:hypothetical protein